ncbi:hypothetical protein [Glacieibacterium frigidum]|uniref:Uncharacterized protein n=1 Tax=Glacieibacterium frigidum TaxID=2593303 RepID=A0A552UH54_9SPHN|nr:hypothetical protein [Glacieibacterium frigidum]TRW17554.1 hypothetical protein FMM06_05220 [Glacieibacterium frigidum]
MICDLRLDPPAAPGPVQPRLVGHHFTEFTQGRVTRWQAVTGADRLEALIFGVVMAANLAHLPFTTAEGWLGIDAPDDLRRPVSMAAIAASMKLPIETVRRRAHGAMRAGLVTIGERGCIAPAGLFATPAMVEVMRIDAAALLDCCNALADEGHGPARAALAAGCAAVPSTVVARLVVDTGIRLMEFVVERYGHVIDAAICIGTVAANVRPMRADPLLSRAYAEYDRPPPDALRQPVTLRQLARELQLPFETVRRRIAPLVARGELAAVGRGFIVPAEVLAGDAYRAESYSAMRAFDRLVRDMERAGAMSVSVQPV